MSKTVLQLAKELTGLFPKLPIDYAVTLINRGWRDICNERDWSFLRAFGIYITPAAISTGAVAVTQYSQTITFNAAAIAVLASLNNPSLTMRQFKVTNGDIYNIESLDADFATNGIATLDRIYLGSTNSASTYTVYRAYYGLPDSAQGGAVSDFKRFITIRDNRTQGYFTNLNGSIDTLNYTDPNRNQVGIPYECYPYCVDSNGNPKFEFYPHPTSQSVLLVDYIKRGIDKTETEQFPSVIPEALVTSRAAYYACDWALQNRGVFPELQKTDWLSEKTRWQRNYSNPTPHQRGLDLGLLEKAMRDDEEIYSAKAVISSNPGQQTGMEDRWGYYDAQQGY